jgi:hypothetical protein
VANVNLGGKDPCRGPDVMRAPERERTRVPTSEIASLK